MNKIRGIIILLLFNTMLYSMESCNNATLDSQALFKVAGLINSGKLDKKSIAVLPQGVRDIIEKILPSNRSHVAEETDSDEEADLNNDIQEIINKLPENVKSWAGYLICLWTSRSSDNSGFLSDLLQKGVALWQKYWSKGQPEKI